MRSAKSLLVALAGAYSTGCFSARPSAPDSFLCQAARNTVQAPIRDCDEAHFIKMTRKQAEITWSEICHTEGKDYSKPYREGFIEGFVDYVESGGTGEPPYLPPFRYRLTPFRNPEGLTAIEDWYAGFRRGSVAARHSGLRELNLIPLPGAAVPIDYNAVDPTRAALPQPKSEGSPWDRPASLPQPRPVPAPMPSEKLMPDPVPPFRPEKLMPEPIPPFPPEKFTQESRPGQIGMRNPPAPELPPLPSVPIAPVSPAASSAYGAPAVTAPVLAAQQPIVRTTGVMAPPPANPPEADPWRSAGPREPVPGPVPH